jgi:hypothetical protein
MRELILDVWPALAHKLPPEDAAPSVKTAAHPARTGRRAFAPGSAGMTFASVLGIEIASTRALKLAASAARLRPHLGFAEFGVCRLQRGGVSIRRVGHRRHDLGDGPEPPQLRRSKARAFLQDAPGHLAVGDELKGVGLWDGVELCSGRNGPAVCVGAFTS